MREGKKDFWLSLKQYLLISTYAILTALSYVIFVFPNDFAPACIQKLISMDLLC